MKTGVRTTSGVRQYELVEQVRHDHGQYVRQGRYGSKGPTVSLCAPYRHGHHAGAEVASRVRADWKFRHERP